jgi:hypothetical protein
MSALIFPSLPGSDWRTLTREPYFATTLHVDGSGVEYGAAWQGAPRYRYGFKINFLRQAVSAVAVGGSYVNGDELSTLTRFFEAHFGQFDSFLWTDPQTSQQVRVRFASDSLKLSKIVTGVYSAEISLVSVK